MISFWLIMTIMIMQNPYSVKSVGDDHIIVDADCFEITKARLALEFDLQKSFTSIKQIVLLPPLQVITFNLLVISTKYPYVIFKLNRAVHNVRLHLQTNFKFANKFNLKYC